MQSRNSSQSPTFNISMASVAQSFQRNSENAILSMRNITTKPQTNNPNDQAKTWVATCRQMLIDMESKNIKTRAVFWTQFVNDTTHQTMDKIHHVLSECNIDATEYPKFIFEVDNPLKHLRFLAEWTGLKTQQMQYMPKSYTEFEYKAKNWLNGRKAPNYALTLFPEMIHHAESYAEQHSAAIFEGNKVAVNLLSTALRYGYLARLCSAKISLNDTGRKTPLLIENSIKTAKSTTSKIFQQYAIDHPYSSQFPSHTSEAASYFESKYQECLQRLIMIVKQCNMNGTTDHTKMMPPTNMMPTIPIPLPTVAMPPIPQIPALSADISTASNDQKKNQTPNNNENGSFNFNMGFTVTDLHQNNPNNNLVSPGSTNSTFNSAPFHMNSPSMDHIHNNNNVFLPARQYNYLVQQLNRLTDTQNSQKDTIHQLVTRLHTLEQRIDSQRQQQQFVAGSNQSVSGQSMTDQFWSNNNGTPSVGYSLAQDFANASNNPPNNLNAMSNINSKSTHSIGSTQTPTTNSSDTPPNNYHYNNNNHMNVNKNNTNDGDIDIGDAPAKDMNNAIPFPTGLMFNDNPHDIHMFSSNPNVNTFPPYI
eukprot:145780_1